MVIIIIISSADPEFALGLLTASHAEVRSTKCCTSEQSRGPRGLGLVINKIQIPKSCLVISRR